MKTSKQVTNRQVIIVIAVAVALLAAVIALSYIFRQTNSDDESALNKDVALRALWDKSVVIGEYDGKNVVLANKDDVFVMLRSGQWTYLTGHTTDDSPEIVFNIDKDYRLLLFSDGHAAVENGTERRFYETPPTVVSELVSYINDTTSISLEDASAFLSVSDTTTVTMQGITSSSASGNRLASAMNIPSWLPSETAIPLIEPALTADNRSGLKISLFDAINIGVIEYNGTKAVYTVDELTVAGALLVAKSYFNDAASILPDKIKEAENLTVISGGEEYNISLNTALTSLLDISKWERRFTEPAGLPENADIIIKSENSFSIRMFKDMSVAEFDNGFYSVPSAVFSSVSLYLEKDDTPPEVPEELLVTVNAAVSTQKQLNVQYKDGKYIMNVKPELAGLLAVSSWTESPVLSLSGSPEMVLTVSSSPLITLGFYPSASSVAVEQTGKTTIYRYASAIYVDLVTYMQSNLFTERWVLSATELGTLQKGAETVEVTFTGTDGSREKYVEAASGTVAILAALNLTPLDDAPQVDESVSTAISFSGADTFIMKLFPTPDGSLAINVTGVFYDKGKFINRWFKAEGTDYAQTTSSLRSIYAQVFDTAAARFCEAIKTGDSAAINTLIGSTAFDYSGMKTLMLNDLSVVKTATDGVYTVTLNVEDPVDSPFTKGENEYILTVSPYDGTATVRSFIPPEVYVVLSNNSPAVEAVDSFTTWVESEGLAFESVDKIENKASVLGYLMLLAHNAKKGSPSEENPSVILFSQADINESAKEYFGLDKFGATDLAAYNSETKLYSYEGKSAPKKYKRVVSLTREGETDIYKVIYAWYADPLCLYMTESVEYTVEKTEAGNFRVISAVLQKEADEEEPADNEEETPPTEETPQEPTDEQPPAETEEESDGEQSSSEPEKETDDEPETEEPSEPFTPQTGLSATETVFKYIEYLNEKSAEKAESLLIKRTSETTEYNFDPLVKISTASCAEITKEYDWYEPWFKDPFSYTCVVSVFTVDTNGNKFMDFLTGENNVEFYLIKETEASDWRIIKIVNGGEGIIN